MRSGPSGSGKTCLSTVIVECPKQENCDIETVSVNCGDDLTRSRVRFGIPEAISSTVDSHQSTPCGDIFEYLRDWESRPVSSSSTRSSNSETGLLSELPGLSPSSRAWGQKGLSGVCRTSGEPSEVVRAPRRQCTSQSARPSGESSEVVRKTLAALVIPKIFELRRTKLGSACSSGALLSLAHSRATNAT